MAERHISVFPLQASRRADFYRIHSEANGAGGCHCGSLHRFPKLLEQYDLLPDPGVWAITCFLIAPRFRKRGLAQRVLSEVLKNLKSRGVSRVQGFPWPGHDLPDEDVWTGPEAIFQKAGFRLEREDPKRPVYSKRL